MSTTPPSRQQAALNAVFVLPALTAGGAERVLITLMNGLDRSVITPQIVVVNEEGELRGLIDNDIPFHALGHGTGVLKSLPRLYKTLKELKPDIVVSTMAHMNIGVLWLSPFFPRTRFIVREAITPSYMFAEKPKLAFAIRAAYKLFYPRADTVISPAQAIIDEFAALPGMTIKNHLLLYNPVNTELIRAAPPATLPPAEARDKTVQFVCAGRLHYQKGFDRLITALPDLRLPYDWQLRILGEGDERPALETLIKQHGLEERVILHGFERTPWPYIAAADAFLLPSRFEGLPNVTLEALACGTPVIATAESGGIAEIAAAAPEDVSIVSTMDEFIAAMAATRPQPAEQMRPSRLPSLFAQDAVQKRFSALLTGAGD